MIKIKGEKKLHKVKLILIILFIVLLLGIIVIQIFDLNNVIMKKIYPQHYAQYINQYAKECEVDPLLIFAIVKVESNFNPNATSKSEAKGLMQLMDNTAKEVANKIEIVDASNLNLYEPETCIKLGTYYFASLTKQYENIGIALAAYNAGMGRVNKWLEQGIIKADGSNLENIPYKETNMYVRKILNDYQTYQEVYGE